MARKGGPKTGGRVAGTPNKSTAEIRELAGKYGPTALAELARLATDANSEQARVSACKELLDRSGPQFLDRWLRSYFPVHQTASGNLIDS